ncbi:hypothetical protein Mmc1_2729 [Magnetococcus marinus MC-1]|uniref:Uncharacterized protein n=1 Tax=Magnetococcus marinus (strain ATCC BAA-1437 / JCM 17883 / MC-1) TaxID=156889 RepID=A0L7B0_MAGMM|nr:hypothetical protein [Magnetococcus marinus]ABK43853.1 hypothetical protein Mmc1_1342 [Magnetococcus marinus MC-1]ABK44531.1 hypothetical protein Mmc1_2030 [Magnetococcus marinus MC-1]ABK45222.1 hypothetical protein Mmc1_2729 [Magnetococcus marinus MC-1]
MPLQPIPLDLGFLDELSAFRWVSANICITIIDESSLYARMQTQTFNEDLVLLRHALSTSNAQVGCMELKFMPSSLLIPVGAEFPPEVHRLIRERPTLEDWEALLQSMTPTPKRVVISCDASGSTNGFGDVRIRDGLSAWIAQLENRGVTVITREYRGERWLLQLIEDMSVLTA